MKRPIQTKLIWGLLPGLFFLIFIGGAGYLSLSNTSQAAHQLLADTMIIKLNNCMNSTI